MSLLPHSEQLLHVAEAVSFGPILLAIVLVSLPISLPLTLYCWIRGDAPADGE